MVRISVYKGLGRTSSSGTTERINAPPRFTVFPDDPHAGMIPSAFLFPELRSLFFASVKPENRLFLFDCRLSFHNGCARAASRTAAGEVTLLWDFCFGILSLLSHGIQAPAAFHEFPKNCAHYRLKLQDLSRIIFKITTLDYLLLPIRSFINSETICATAPSPHQAHLPNECAGLAFEGGIS